MSDTTTLTAPMGVMRPKRLMVLAAMTVLALAPGHLGELTRELMTDAYVQVSVFVAATLLLFYGAERLFNFDIGEVLSKSKRAQVPLAALLGSTPGCGGAVVVVAAYSSGHVGFGAVVATLTATMGDAAFLLIATRPDAAMVVLPLSLVVGILSGWLVDYFHSVEYRASTLASCDLAPLIGRTRPQDIAYLLLAIPGFYVGAMQLGQIDVSHIFGLPIQYLALVGTFLGLSMWATSKVSAMTNAKDSPLTRMA
ncbi:putative manganese transporter, partial [Gelidibacter sp. F2691]|nr:putative manganese transporter [Gelidibacter sp. F2691]